MANEIKIACVNVFQHEEKKDLEQAFTAKWVELINQYEKEKEYSAPIAH